ncbi:hypothetical protein D3C80_1314770 [compost metagenome]
MGNIVQQVLLRLHQGLELASHAVAVLGQLDDLVAALAQPGFHAHIEPALSYLAHGFAQPGQRASQVQAAQEGKQRTHQRAGKQRAHASRTRRFAKHRGHRSTQHQRATLAVAQRLLETRHRHRPARQQLAFTVIKAHLHIRRLR